MAHGANGGCFGGLRRFGLCKDAPYLQRSGSEVQQQPPREPRALHVVDRLSHIGGTESAMRLQFHHDLAEANEVDAKRRPQQTASAMDGHQHFAPSGNPQLFKLDRKRLRGRRLQQTRAQGPMHLHGSADDLVRERSCTNPGRAGRLGPVARVGEFERSLVKHNPGISRPAFWRPRLAFQCSLNPAIPAARSQTSRPQIPNAIRTKSRTPGPMPTMMTANFTRPIKVGLRCASLGLETSMA